MAVYGIGDIQGCYDELRQLLDRLEFDSSSDRLLLTGDLVNRGPDSLAVLRFVRSLGDCATTVLGNHDLHLLAIAEGVGRLKRHDTVSDVLESGERDELLAWLRQQPLAWRDEETGWLLVHAGLVPQWTGDQTLGLSDEVEAMLRGPDYREFFRNMYGNEPDLWDERLSGWPRLRFITNALTRLRYCDAAGRVDFVHKEGPDRAPAELLPWFRVPGRRCAGERVVFGHWSTLGYLRENGVLALDDGCLWGGRLVAVRLDEPESEPVRIDCRAKQAVGTP
jgi:bis(5'-nucleosyl)-tetraphosphatase (symmetrical)